MKTRRSICLRRAVPGAVAVAVVATFIVWGTMLAQNTAPPPPTFYDSPDDYDLAAIQADPDAYYAQSVPSRVWQLAPAPPGKERHPEILIEGSAFRFVAEDTQLPEPLVVRAKPGRPVTFTALDQGEFANGEHSITVPADEQGYARVEFSVAGVGNYRVLAGSPENHGPAEFVIQAMSESDLKEFASGRYAREYWEQFNKSPHAETLLSGQAETSTDDKTDRQPNGKAASAPKN